MLESDFNRQIAGSPLRSRTVIELLRQESGHPQAFNRAVQSSLHNAPVDQFGVSYQSTVDKCWGWVNGANAADLMCANGIHPLVRDNTRASWAIQRFIDFMGETQKLWLQWK